MVYIFFFSLMLIGASISKGRKSSAIYLAVMMSLLYGVIGLRDISVGPDTLSYTKDFARFSRMDFFEMWNYAFSSKEALYVIISWFPSLLSTNYTTFLLTWALFPVCSLYSVYKSELYDSMDYVIAIIVFFLLGLFAFYVAGIRQTAALSLVFIAGSRCLRADRMDSIKSVLKSKAIYNFMFVIGVAYLIHNSSILFLIAIPLLFFKVRWWYLPCVIGLFWAGRIIHLDQIFFFSELVFEDRFTTYELLESSQNLSAFIMQIILFLICFVVRKKLVVHNAQNNFYLALLLIGLVFQSLSGSLAEMARISFYFSMFAMILVPRAIRQYSDNNRKLLYLFFIVLSLFYLFFLTSTNLPEYHSVL